MDKNLPPSYHRSPDKTDDNPMNMTSYGAHLHNRNLALLKLPFPDDGKLYMADVIKTNVISVPSSIVSELMPDPKDARKGDHSKNAYFDLSKNNVHRENVYDQTRRIVTLDGIAQRHEEVYRLPSKNYYVEVDQTPTPSVPTAINFNAPSVGSSFSSSNNVEYPPSSSKKPKKPPNEKPKKDRKVLHPQAKELILNVLNYMKEEANGEFALPPRKVQGRTAKATGFSERTIRRVVKESKMASTEGATSAAVTFQAKKTANRPKPKTGLDALTQCSVRKLIHRIYVNEKTVPTIKKIHQRLVEEINFKGGTRSAHKIVKELGFYWKKTKAKSFVLMEKHEIRLRRIEYLRDITRLRHEGRHVVYVGDTILCLARAPQPVTAILACSDNGLIRESVYTVPGEADLSPHLEGWTREALCPFLPPRSVVVIDSAVSSNQEKIPTLDTDADTMKSWLTAKGIPYKPDMLRTELYQIIKRSAGRLKKHKSAIEVVLTEAGHSVLKVPADHPDLNPASLIWADVKNTLSDPQSAGSGEGHLAELVTKLLCGIDVNVWNARCSAVRSCEKQYLACEGIVDAQVERVLTGSKEGVPTSDELDDPQENNINFVRHFMGGLLGLGEEQKMYNLQQI